MSVDIWFTQDISQIILAAVRANEQALAAERADSDLPHDWAYHRGFRAALSTMAVALGLPLPPHVNDEERLEVAERPPTINTNPCLFVQEENADTRQSRLSVVPTEESRGHGSAVV